MLKQDRPKRPSLGASFGNMARRRDPRQALVLAAGRKEERPLSNMSMEMILRRMKIENATMHGFRSSFRDWVGNETDFQREVAEAALAHVVGDAVEQSYRRGDALEKRRALMDAWGEYCERTGTNRQSLRWRFRSGTSSRTVGVSSRRCPHR